MFVNNFLSFFRPSSSFFWLLRTFAIFALASFTDRLVLRFTDFSFLASLLFFARSNGAALGIRSFKSFYSKN